MPWLYHDFIHAFGGHLDWFKPANVANGMALKIQGFMFSSFRHIPRSGIAGPHDKFMFNSPRKWQTFLQQFKHFTFRPAVWGASSFAISLSTLIISTLF